MQQRLPSLLDAPIAFGHRGARANAPENTLESFELALKLGANGLESDVWLTSDGIPVLDHDGVVQRRWRPSTPISEVPRDRLPGHIPTLGEVIERCGSAYHLSLDLKTADSGQRIIDVVREAAPAMLDRVWLCSPVWQTLGSLRGQGARLVDSTRLSKMKEGPERRAATLSSEGIDAVNLHHTDWNGGLVALFHRFERCTFSWDMQETHLLRAAWRMGLDGVFSDHVDRMVEAYTEEIGRPQRPGS